MNFFYTFFMSFYYWFCLVTPQKTYFINGLDGFMDAYFKNLNCSLILTRYMYMKTELEDGNKKSK